MTVKTKEMALMKEGIQLLAKIQKNEEEKTANKNKQKKAQIEFNQAKPKSINSQKEVEQLHLTLNSAKKVKKVLASGQK